MKARKSSFGMCCFFALALIQQACLPPSDAYPNKPPAEVINEALQWSENLEQYIVEWTQGLTPDSIPSHLIPMGISDSKNFYLKHPDEVSAAETWAVRYAKPIQKDSLYAGIPDPKVTYLFLGTALAPFGSKLVLEGEFPHCRFFSVQITPPLNGVEYYAQRQFGTAEISVADADIEPLPGNTNPFRVGADRNAADRKYRLEFDLTTGDPVSLNSGGHVHPYRLGANTRKGAMLVYQGPLGHKTVAGTPLPTPGDWNLGALWLRIYEPDNNVDALGGVPMPKVWFELPNGERYFMGSDFTPLQQRADFTIANRITDPNPDAGSGPNAGWFKSWGITRSMLNGVCIANNWSRPDSGARVNQIELGWTGRGEFQPAPGNYEPHATTNNYATYLGRSMTVPPGMVAVLTGTLPTFPSTRNGEATMQSAQVRYWSICGIDQDPLSPLPATTIHAIADADVVIDHQRNYIIAYSRPGDRPVNATASNGVSWVDWGTQSSHGLLMRWVCVSPEWTFPFAPHENHLDWAHSDWAGSQYDSTLLGVNWRNGFMECYLPKVHYLSTSEFEALGANLSAEKIPVWVDETYKTGPSEALLGTLSATSVLDDTPANAVVNANDNDFNTAWSSAFGEQNAAITVDLGRIKTISAVKLYWDWIFFAKNYTVQVSADNLLWTTVAAVSEGNGQIDLFKNLQDVKGRYVRLSLTQHNAGWYRLGEFEVYTNDCDCNETTTGINTPGGTKSRLEVFPNPAREALNYRLRQAPAVVDLALFDAKGQLVRQLQKAAPEGKIDVNGLLPGVYVLRLKGPQGWMEGRKVVVVR
ncbi:MAG: discoidin domain-containing protein [Saprospiraceae bacterium]|nr:discoidin domain-containing protein [Saprospiraceae bacterium]